MGYIRHHAIAITVCDSELIKEVHIKAKSIFKNKTSEILDSVTNGYLSFFIGPDGSKEGWEESNIGNEQRETFLNWVNEQSYEDGSNSISFCEFFYGDDNGNSQIENHN